MKGEDLKRLSRLTAILVQLQSKRLVTATQLAERFGVSQRTIYRDMRALEQAGIPIVIEEGRGYTMMEGYRVPPVMFTEGEANALITAEKLVHKNKDLSLSKNYSDAINKIKSVLEYAVRDKANLLAQRILVRPQVQYEDTSDSLGVIQNALTSYNVLCITYEAATTGVVTKREVEPFALYNNTLETWNLIALCRLRKDYRLFRLDRIREVSVTGEKFEPHQITLEQYVDMQRKKHVVKPLT